MRSVSNNQDLHQHLEVIFGLVVNRGAHLETSTCSKRGVAAWHGVYDAYFNRIHGAGRAYALWADAQAGLAKFCKSIMAALAFHADVHDQLVLGVAPLSLQLQAHDIMGARTTAIADADAVAEAARQHEGALQQANLAIGLIPPGRGAVAPPNPGIDLTCQEQEALRILSARTRLPFNRKFD